MFQIKFTLTSPRGEDVTYIFRDPQLPVIVMIFQVRGSRPWPQIIEDPQQTMKRTTRKGFRAGVFLVKGKRDQTKASSLKFQHSESLRY